MKNFKKVLALVLAVATLLSFATIASAATSADYKDAAAIEKNGQTEAVDVLSYIGVLAGYPDKNFKADNEITRAEAAKIIAMFDNGSTDISSLYASANPFTDVKGNWAESYVAYGYKAGIIAGVGKLLFAPNAKLTGVQFLKMVLVVLGYDAKTEGLEGPSWAVNTLALAKKIGLLDNLPATFNAAANLTRGDAATIMLNALNTDTVVYGQAFLNSTVVNGVIPYNYLTVAGAIDTGKPLYKEWGLSKATSYDVWGAPNHSWAKSGKTFVTYEDTPVLTYTKAVKTHDLLIDLGVAATSGSTKTIDYIVRNGALLDATTADSLTAIPANSTYDVKDTVLKHSTDYNCMYGITNQHTTTTTGTTTTDVAGTNVTATIAAANQVIGGQGALTRVFKLDSGKYAIVTIDTYLAQVKAVVANTHYVAASLTMSVWDNTVLTDNTNDPSLVPGVSDYSGTYAKGDYALVYRVAGNAFGGTVGDVTVNSIAKPTANGVLTAYLLGTSTTVGGTTYPDACQFDLGYHGAYNSSYDVFVDSYGNIIGLTVPATSYTFGVFDAIAWQNSVGLASSYVEANVIDMTGAKAEKVTVSKGRLDDGISTDVDLVNAETYATGENYNLGDATLANSYVSTDKEKNTYPAIDKTISWTQNLYMFTKNSAGEYVIAAQGTDLTSTSIVKGIANLWGTTSKYATNDYTQYLVKTIVNGTVTYTAYTGYQNVPSYTNVSVSYFPASDNVYVGYVFVDATGENASVAKTEVAYIYAGNEIGIVNGYPTYNVTVDGDVKQVSTTGNGTTQMDAVTTPPASGLYKLSYNSDDKVVAVTAIAAAAGVRVDMANLTGCYSTVITNSTVTTQLTDAKFYQITSTGIVKLADAAAVQTLIDTLNPTNPSAKLYTVNATVLFPATDTTHGNAVYITVE